MQWDGGDTPGESDLIVVAGAADQVTSKEKNALQAPTASVTTANAIDAPKSQPCWRNTNDAAQPLGPGVQLAMPQESADILGYHLFLDVEVDQTIPRMTQSTIIEIAVEREERWPVQLM